MVVLRLHYCSFFFHLMLGAKTLNRLLHPTNRRPRPCARAAPKCLYEVHTSTGFTAGSRYSSVPYYAGTSTATAYYVRPREVNGYKYHAHTYLSIRYEYHSSIFISGNNIAGNCRCDQNAMAMTIVPCIKQRLNDKSTIKHHHGFAYFGHYF